MIDTILAVGFAAATLASVSSDQGEDAEVSAVSAIGVGTATTAAFIASAAHGHNSIQNCLALRHKSVPHRGAATAVAQGGEVQGPGLVSRASFAISAAPTP